MKQLKKGKAKETTKQRKERKKDLVKTKEQVFTIVIPTLILAAVFIVIIVYVYIKTRPKGMDMD